MQNETIEDENTLGEEDLAEANYNLIEALKFFDYGCESGTFKIDKKLANDSEAQQDLIVTMRKHKIKHNGIDVVMVTVRDVTDEFNFKEARKFQKEDQARSTVLSVDLSTSVQTINLLMES